MLSAYNTNATNFKQKCISTPARTRNLLHSHSDKWTAATVLMNMQHDTPNQDLWRQH
jgi:hypothetical protein